MSASESSRASQISAAIPPERGSRCRDHRVAELGAEISTLTMP
ncbi:hypothetical protein [Streptomyces marianii]|nr:hypothetical protein [Streptomyces marianii]